MSNYIDISKQQRIVFVDNLTHEEAKNLSEIYKFGVFFASKSSNLCPAIYREGKRYSEVTKVNKTPIKIGDYNIGLTLDINGELGLALHSAISNFICTNVGAPYININNEEDYLTFKFFDNENNEITPTSYLNFEGEILDGNYIRIEYIGDVNRYKVTVLKSTNGYKNLTVSYPNIAGGMIALTLNIETIKLVENDIFYIGTDIASYDITVLDTDISNNYNAGWHNISGLITYYGDNPMTIDSTNFCVILPNTYTLAVRMKNDNGKYYVTANGQLEDFDQNLQVEKKINGNNQYTIYKLKTDMGITKFIYDIVRKN